MFARLNRSEPCERCEVGALVLMDGTRVKRFVYLIRTLS